MKKLNLIFDNQKYLFKERSVYITWLMSKNKATFNELCSNLRDKHIKNNVTPGLLSIFKHFYLNVPAFKQAMKQVDKIILLLDLN